MCMGNCSPTLLNRASLQRVPRIPCHHKTFIYQLVDPLPWLPTCTVYQACILNELHSLYYRHLIDNGVPSQSTTTEMLCSLQKQFPPVACQPVTREMVIARKPDGPSKRRYQRAKDSLVRWGPSVNWARVSAFIKVEKWEVETVENNKPPRLIQFRTYPYCLEVSRPIIAIEAFMWKWKMNGLPVFAKGMSSFALGDLFNKAAHLFDHPVFVMMDHSKFDASLSKELIQDVEHAYYLQCYNDPLFRYQLEQQLDNYCVSKNGIKYKCVGRKMSGEYNTSCGDSLVNLAIIMHTMDKTGLRYHPLINGDDSVVVCEANPLISPDNFKQYGMKTVVDVTEDFSQVEFCQSRPIQVRPGVWRMVRNPERVMTRGVVSVKSYVGIGWAKLVNSIGMCEKACNDGVPILQEFSNYLLRSAGRYTKGYLKNEITYRAKLESTLTPVDKTITSVARLSFAKSFGYSPTQQLMTDQTKHCLLYTSPSPRD